MASLSLKRQFTRYTALPFIVVGVLLVLILWATDYAARQAQADETLNQRALAVKVNFSAYLDRAEFEARYLAQQVGNDGDLDSLFQLHDVLFFGGLDFFYIELANGQRMVDPRSRLYTRDPLEQMASKSRLNFWSHISSSEGSELLVFKKVLPVDDAGRIKGYLYGFVSLDNNLALSSDLMSGANVDFMRLQDLAGKTLLEDEHPAIAQETATIVHTSILSLPALVDKFRLELSIAQPLSLVTSQWFLIAVSTVMFGLALLYWCSQYYARKWMFRPLSSMPAMPQKGNARFVEFEPLIAQMNRFQSQLKAREQHLQLLLDSLHSAIFFCDESARVTAMNQDAKTVFPEHAVAKTIFDMAPLAFHQPVQSALKGDYGGRFETEVKHLNKIYEWLTYSYVNEYGFRGVMLVGRDITELRRLSWHLDSLHPNNALDRPRPESEILLREMSLLDNDTEEGAVASDRWLLVISRLLRGVSQKIKFSPSPQSLGNFLIEQLDDLEQLLQLEPSQLAEIELSVPLDVAEKVAYWNSDHKWLFQVALLLCLNGRITGRRLTIEWHADKLKIAVQGVSEPTPVLTWLLDALPNLVKGRVVFESSGRIVLISTIEALDVEADNTLLAYKTVAFVENDLAFGAQVKTLLMSLNIEVDSYGSFDEFFHSSRALLATYNGLLVGMGDQEKGSKGVERLSAMCSENEGLPVMYVGDSAGSDQFPRLPLGHLFSYGILKVLRTIFEYPAINMKERLQRESHWLLAGGNALTQAIWQTELSSQGIVARKESDIERIGAALRYSKKMVVLVLDQQTAQRLVTLNLLNEQITWVTTEDFSGRPDILQYFDVGNVLPNSDQVAALRRQINS